MLRSYGEVSGWGPTARGGSVAREWGALARLMAEQEADFVAEVDPEELVQRAQKLWVVPPGGSLLVRLAVGEPEGSEDRAACR